MKQFQKIFFLSNKAFYLFLIVSLPVISISVILLSSVSTRSTEVRTKAADVAAGSGVAGIQAAIDASSDGETIVIPPGEYSGPMATPIRQGLSGNRGGAATCFIQIENKKITIKAGGVLLQGEGHSQPNVDPYATRAGICVYNSQVTFDGLRLKEFQGRGMVVNNSSIVYKNGIVDGHDSGGISMLGNSTGVFVNNLMAEMNVGGIMLWQNSRAVIVNNIFYNAAVLYFYHPGSNDQARADIINNIFSEVKSDIAQVGWWKADPAQLKSSKLSHNIIYRAKDNVCDPGFELWCDDFPGKINADPLYAEPVTDPHGVYPWANFGFKEGSPAINAGTDGTNLGNSGGPCADGNSSACTSFIEQQKTQFTPPVTPTSAMPTSEPYIPPPDDNIPLQPTKPPINDDGPPITYYLPPTMSFTNPNQPINNQPPGGTENRPTPTVTPTPKPLIDVAKTVESAKNSWNNFIISIIQFTKTILP